MATPLLQGAGFETNIQKSEEQRPALQSVPEMPVNFDSQLRACLEEDDEEVIGGLRYVVETLSTDAIALLNQLTESDDPRYAMLAVVMIPEVLKRAIAIDHEQQVYTSDELDQLRDNFAYLMESDEGAVKQLALDTFRDNTPYLMEHDKTTYGWLVGSVNPPKAWKTRA